MVGRERQPYRTVVPCPASSHTIFVDDSRSPRFPDGRLPLGCPSATAFRPAAACLGPSSPSLLAPSGSLLGDSPLAHTFSVLTVRSRHAGSSRSCRQACADSQGLDSKAAGLRAGTATKNTPSRAVLSGGAGSGSDPRATESPGSGEDESPHPG